MIFSLLGLMLIVAAGLTGIILLAGAVMLLLTFRVGTALSHHVGGLFSILVVLLLAIFVIRGMRSPVHGGRASGAHHSRPQYMPPPPPLPPPHAIGQGRPLHRDDSEETSSLTEDPQPVSAGGESSAGRDNRSEVPLSVRETSRDAVGRIERERDMNVLPEWVSRPATAMAPRQPSVLLHSQRFATFEEAHAQIEQLTRKTVSERLQLRLPRLRRWSPPLPDLEETGLVRRSCVIIWPVTVGEFQESVTQIYWQLNFSPDVEQRLAASIKEGTVRTRLTALFGLITAGTVLMAVGSRLLLRQKAR